MIVPWGMKNYSSHIGMIEVLSFRVYMAPVRLTIRSFKSCWSSCLPDSEPYWRMCTVRTTVYYVLILMDASHCRGMWFFCSFEDLRDSVRFYENTRMLMEIKLYWESWFTCDTLNAVITLSRSLCSIHVSRGCSTTDWTFFEERPRESA